MVIRKKIIVTGANGQLGMELQQLASSYPAFNLFSLHVIKCRLMI
jgi:dTDP-4-dehydrorhamnose reductase